METDYKSVIQTIGGIAAGYGGGDLLYRAVESFSKGEHGHGAGYAGAAAMCLVFAYSMVKEAVEERLARGICKRLDNIESKLTKPV